MNNSPRFARDRQLQDATRIDVVVLLALFFVVPQVFIGDVRSRLWLSAFLLLGALIGGSLANDIPRRIYLLVAATATFSSRLLLGAELTSQYAIVLRVFTVLLLACELGRTLRAIVDRQHLALRTDSLTGLPNKTGFMENLCSISLLKEKLAALLLVIVIDCDGFKGINDTGGHLAGDHYLQTAASKILQQLQHSEIAGRWGGDEFLVAMYVADRPEAQKRLEQLRDVLKDTSIDGLDSPSWTVGGYLVPSSERSLASKFADSWLHQADQAMYNSKQHAMLKVTLYPV